MLGLFIIRNCLKTIERGGLIEVHNSRRKVFELKNSVFCNFRTCLFGFCLTKVRGLHS